MENARAQILDNKKIVFLFDKQILMHFAEKENK